MVTEVCYIWWQQWDCEETEDTSELTVDFLETVVEEIHARLGKVVTSLCPGKGRKGLSIS